MQVSETTLLVVGCGYLGTRVAARWQSTGRVYALTRSAARAAQFAERGWQPVVADLMVPTTLSRLPAVTTVLFAVGHDRAAPYALADLYVQGLRNLLGALPDSVERLIYVSSTGVYGDHGGDWVDEDSPCSPDRPGGKASLAAEILLSASRFGQRTIVLRMAGLYGPGRLPRQAALHAGEEIPAPEAGWLNLIHVDDAASAVLAAEAWAAEPLRPLPSSFCVTDGNPVARREYFQESARQVGAPPPRFRAPDAGDPVGARAEADKRVSNRRMLAELRPILSWGDYRAGLAASLAAERSLSPDGVDSLALGGGDSLSPRGGLP